MDFIIAFIQNTEDQKKNRRGRGGGGIAVLNVE